MVGGWRACLFTFLPSYGGFIFYMVFNFRYNGREDGPPRWTPRCYSSSYGFPALEAMAPAITTTRGRSRKTAGTVPGATRADIDVTNNAELRANTQNIVTFICESRPKNTCLAYEPKQKEFQVSKNVTLRYPTLPYHTMPKILIPLRVFTGLLRAEAILRQRHGYGG